MGVLGDRRTEPDNYVDADPVADPLKVVEVDVELDYNMRENVGSVVCSAPCYASAEVCELFRLRSRQDVQIKIFATTCVRHYR